MISYQALSTSCLLSEMTEEDIKTAVGVCRYLRIREYPELKDPQGSLSPAPGSTKDHL